MAKKAGKTNARAWQRMLSGRRLDLLDPSPFDVELEDIAHGLARVARWNGQTIGDHAFSVAQHSVVVEEIARMLEPELTPDWQLVVLLHDAPEYVIGDMISPFKNVLGGNYREVEHGLHQAIHLRFSLPADPPVKITKLAKRADIISAYFEAVELAGFSKDEAKELFGSPDDLTPSQQKIIAEMVTPQEPVVAQAAFIGRFQAIEKAFSGQQ
ncbi:HD family hydrolase [Rhodobacteraceae bacterium RKSG542]|uniref:YfbR-like 5'-deoxynucleotidase n=1 Tax=Pseudovibrio flavus TaxID=2529854 RepID=UPI0012BD694C|nr:HD family hydrolase [Pseudovibrio flavus]MTI18712.1 HD family hydrolase [Pseudovibrio flavus]